MESPKLPIVLPLDEFLPVVKLFTLKNPKDHGIMTKQKTHKSTKKRMRITANGKVKHRKAGTSHLAISKPAKKIRQLRGTRVLEHNFERAVHDALGKYSY